MLAPPLHRRRHIENLVRREARSGGDLAQRRPPARESPRLVEDDGVDSGGKLERFAAADQDARLRAVARANHDRRRRGQAHGTWAGDHHDGNERHEGMGEVRLRAQDKPKRERGGAQDEDDRHEDGRDAVGQALDLRLRPLRAPHEIYDLRQSGIPSDPCGAEHECAVAVHRPADHFGSGPLLRRDRLTGQHCFIDRGGAFHYASIDRHTFAGSDAHEVADADFFERHIDLGAGPYDASGTSLQPDECLYGADCLAFRPGLQPAAGQDEADDRGRAVEVSLRFDAGGAKQVRRECHEHAERPRRCRAHDDERVHARRSVACGPQGGAIEAAAGQELDGRCGADEHPRGLLHHPWRVREVHHQHRQRRD